MGKVFGIDITRSEIRAVAMASGRGRLGVSRAERYRIPAEGEWKDRLAAASMWMQQFMRAEGGGLAVVGLPAFESAIKMLDLPPAGGAALDELVRFEADHALPFSAHGAAIDHVVVKTTADGITVLVAAARRELVATVSHWIRSIGGKSRRVTVTAPARLTLPLLQPVAGAAANQVTAIVDVNEGSADIVLAENGALRVSRAVGLLNGDAVRSAAVEVRRTVQAHRAARRGATLDRVLFCGSGGPEEDAPARMEAELGSPVARLDPWVGLAVSGTASSLPTNERAVYGAATGLALQGMGRGLQLNLLPEDERGNLSPQTRQGIMRCSAFLVALLSAVVWLATHPLSPISRSNLLQQQYNATRDQLDGVKLKISSKGKAPTATAGAITALADEIRKDSVQWLEVLRLLSASLPAEVRLTELSMEKGQSVVVRGNARDNVQVADTLVAIQEMPMFIDARIAFANSAIASNNETKTEFEIVCTLEPLARAKGKRR